MSATTTLDATRPEADAAAPAVDVRDVTYRFADRIALAGVSLTVPRGAIHALLGPNGSGKSTLLSLLLGERRPASGDVRVLGRAPSPALRARIAMVFQERTLDPLMTVHETMLFHARLFGMAKGAARSRATRLLERLGLAGRAADATSTLSGGLKRRLELARALLPAPQVILLDEPTLALDPDARAGLWQHLIEENAAGATLVVATNEVQEAERYCQTVTLLEHGRVVAEGAPDSLKHSLRREAVRIEWKDGAVAGAGAMERWPGVGNVRQAGRVTHVTVDQASAFLARLFADSGDRVHAVTVEQSTLEDVYFQLTGRGISTRPQESTL